MGDVRVDRIMSTDLVTVDESDTVAAAARRMLESDVGSVLVVDEKQRLRGLLTATDFVRLVRENDPEDETPVDVCMTTDVLTAGRDDTLDDLKALVESGYTHFPVTADDDEVVGVVSTTDLTARLAGR